MCGHEGGCAQGVGRGSAGESQAALRVVIVGEREWEASIPGGREGSIKLTLVEGGPPAYGRPYSECTSTVLPLAVGVPASKEFGGPIKQDA